MSKSEGHCSVCHAHFVNPRAFDMHFGRDGEHLDPATQLRRDGQPRYVARHRTFGVTWALAFYGVTPANYGQGLAGDADNEDDDTDSVDDE